MSSRVPHEFRRPPAPPVVAALLLIAAVPALARAGEQAAPPAKPPVHAHAPGTMGMRVFIDPVTGERVARPTRQAIAASRRTFVPPARTKNLRTERLADGTVLVHLDETWMEYAVASTGAPGKARFVCRSGIPGARRHAAPPAKTPVWVEE